MLLGPLLLGAGRTLRRCGETVSRRDTGDSGDQGKRTEGTEEALREEGRPYSVAARETLEWPGEAKELCRKPGRQILSAAALSLLSLQ